MFRAMLQTDMKEARTGRVVVEDIDPETMELVIGYVYTGQLEVGTEADISRLVYAADKYDLPGLKALAYFSVASGDLKIKQELIADMLIMANLHQSREMEEQAIQKLRNNREVLRDPEFRKKFKDTQNIDLLFDIMEKL